MAREGQALKGLRKLQADRLALEEKQRGLEAQAALELGQLLMGTGLETFAPSAIRKIAMQLGSLGEELALKHVTAPMK